MSKPRAILASLVLLVLCISMVVSAPVSERLSNLAERYDEYDGDVSARSIRDRALDMASSEHVSREYLSILDGREFDIDAQYTKREFDLFVLDDRDFDEIGHEFTKRDDSDVHVLYRRKVAAKVKAFFKKVGTAIKKTVAKVAKVYLKVVAAVATVASKVVKFIPGVGNGLSLAIKGTAIGANAASDKIHAPLGKFGKFTKGLNYVTNAGGSIAGKAGKGGKIAKALLF